MTCEELARAVYDRCHRTGSFVLRSGRTSSEYFDKYLFESDPALLAEVARHLRERVLPGLGDVQVLAGLELGGVPVATALSLLTGTPQVFVRKKAKQYGTARLAEGVDVAGKAVALVEDVVTTGGQVSESAAELRKLGALRTVAVCVILRDAAAADRLAAGGVTLKSLFVLEAGRLSCSAGGSGSP